MNLGTTAMFYAIFGVAVAIATSLRSDVTSRGELALQVLSAGLFWPLYVPFLLHSGPRINEVVTAKHGHLESAIRQVERELDAAWQSLDGWAEEALSRESVRLSELRRAWRAQADRIHELDGVLAHSERAADWLSGETKVSERVRQSDAARREHLERLEVLRQQLSDDLLGTLAWVRELAAMIHVAKYSGAPASRAEELVSRIAAAIEGLSEVHEWEHATGTQAAG